MSVCVNSVSVMLLVSVMPGTGAAGGQTTIVMPLGSSAATSGAGYVPSEVTVSSGATIVWPMYPGVRFNAY